MATFAITIIIISYTSNKHEADKMMIMMMMRSRVKKNDTIHGKLSNITSAAFRKSTLHYSQRRASSSDVDHGYDDDDEHKLDSLTHLKTVFYPDEHALVLHRDTVVHVLTLLEEKHKWNFYCCEVNQQENDGSCEQCLLHLLDDFL